MGSVAMFFSLVFLTIQCMSLVTGDFKTLEVYPKQQTICGFAVELLEGP
jgi:hypothetical protein